MLPLEIHENLPAAERAHKVVAAAARKDADRRVFAVCGAAHDLEQRAVAADGPQAHRAALRRSLARERLAVALALRQAERIVPAVRRVERLCALHEEHGRIFLPRLRVDDINIPQKDSPSAAGAFSAGRRTTDALLNAPACGSALPGPLRAQTVL